MKPFFLSTSESSDHSLGIAAWAILLGLSGPFLLSTARAEMPAGSPMVKLPNQTEVNGYVVLGVEEAMDTDQPLYGARPGDEVFVYELKSRRLSTAGEWQISADGVLRKQRGSQAARGENMDDAAKIIFLRRSSTAKSIQKVAWELKKDIPFLRSKVSLAADWVPNEKGEMVSVPVKLPIELQLHDAMDSDGDKKADLMLIKINGQGALLHLSKTGNWHVVVQPLGGC
jgi:hypothetical protein